MTQKTLKICLSSHGINAAASQLTVAGRLEGKEEYLEDRWVGGGGGGVLWAYEGICGCDG
jgi:hypothetical protein